MNRKKIEKILAILCGVILLGVLRPTAVSAAVCTVSVTSATGYVGEEITVTCSVNQLVTAATIALSYDPSCLEFKSASSSFSKGGGGRILLDTDISELQGIKVSYTITFRALKASTSQVVVLPGQSDVVDAEGDNYELDCGAATVTVKNHSSDASLRSLAVSPGTLSPDFWLDRLRYTVRVGNSVRSLAVEAAVRDAEASGQRIRQPEQPERRRKLYYRNGDGRRRNGAGICHYGDPGSGGNCHSAGYFADSTRNGNQNRRNRST